MYPSDGWIKLHRKMLSWEWYEDTNTFRVFLHLLLNANHKPTKWRGIDLQAGQLVTGRLKLAEALNLSEMQVRTSLKKLKSTNEITIKATKQNSIITLNNWNEYQQNNQQDNHEITTKEPTNNQQVTTDKNDKNIRKEEKNVPLPPSGGAVVSIHSAKDSEPKTSSNSRYQFSDDDKAVAEFFFGKIREVNPNHKEPNVSQWANDIRLMRERDKRTHDEIKDMVTWALGHSFWRSNILCPSKLRQQWDKLTIQKQSVAPSTRGIDPNKINSAERQGGSGRISSW